MFILIGILLFLGFSVFILFIINYSRTPDSKSDQQIADTTSEQETKTINSKIKNESAINGSSNTLNSTFGETPGIRINAMGDSPGMISIEGNALLKELDSTLLKEVSALKEKNYEKKQSQNENVKKADDAVNSSIKIAGTNPKNTGTNPKNDGTNPKIAGMNPKIAGTNPKNVGIDQKKNGVDKKSDKLVKPVKRGIDLVKNGKSYLNRGIQWKTRDMHEKSAREFEKAEDQFARTLVEPSSPDAEIQALYYLGCLYFEKNQWKRSIDYFNLASKRDEKSLYSLYSKCNLASIYFANDEFGKSRKIFEKIIDDPRLIKDPNYRDFSYYMALIYYKFNEFDKAVVYFSRTLEIDPADKDVHLKLAAIYQSLNKHELAIDQYKRALILEPDCAFTCNQIGAVYFSKKEYKKSQKWHERAIMNDSEMTEAYYNLACAFQAAGETKNSLKIFKKVLEMDPSFPEAEKVKEYVSKNEKIKR